jgi:hypothetical protein
LEEPELAERLRERLRRQAPELASRAGFNESQDVIISTNRTGDRAIIESYTTCPDCGTMECSYEKAIELARCSATVDEWLDNLDGLRGAHLARND